MSFIKSIWKSNSKHKKLCEEIALASSVKDLSGEDEEAFEDGESSDATTYNVKYLGNTIVDAARSENATKEAVKSIINSAKSSGKNKLQRVTLSISPKGIEMFDVLSLETLLQVSIYNISYCSADANHSDVFAFVSCDNPIEESQAPRDNDSEGTLTCYAFLCQKKKVAQEVTLTVARSFERAYQLWRKNEQSTSRRKNDSNVKKNIKNKEKGTTNEVVNLLIDLDANLACTKDSREYLQNTWVNFEDDSVHEMPHSQLNHPLWESSSRTLVYS